MTEVVCCLQITVHSPGQRAHLTLRHWPLRWITMLWRVLQMWGRWSERDCLQTRHSASREWESRALVTSLASVTISAMSVSVSFIWRQYPDFPGADNLWYSALSVLCQPLSAVDRLLLLLSLLWPPEPLLAQLRYTRDWDRQWAPACVLCPPCPRLVRVRRKTGNLAPWHH